MALAERVEIEELALPKPRLVSPTPTETVSLPQNQSTNLLLAAFDSILPIFSAITAVLAIRAYLLGAIIGAFMLAQAAMGDESGHGLWVLGIYCAFTILPLVYLDLNGGRKRG